MSGVKKDSKTNLDDRIRKLTLMLQKNPPTDMGEPVRKASGRTFHPMSTLVSDTCRSSPQVESSHSLKTSNQPPSEALKSGLPMAVFATVKLTQRYSPRL